MALEFAAGCLGGCAGVLVGHPFDTIKVRLQTQCSTNPKYRGTWHCFSQTVKTESVRGLYKGMSSPLAGVSFVNAIIFGVHGNIMKRVKDPSCIKSQAIAGAGAGLMQAFIASPMELVKTRMQIQSNSGSSSLYKSPLECLKNIFRTEGLKGVFRGQKITIMREIPGFATYFASYEYLIRKLSPDGETSTAAILMAGGLAGTFSWIGTYPLDVVKTRLQTDGIDGKVRYKGILHCLKTSINTEGFSVLTRGLNSTIIRAFPTNAATFAVVSSVMTLAEETEHCLAESHAWRDVIARGEILLSAAAEPLTKKMYPSILHHRKEITRLAAQYGVLPCVFALEEEEEEDDDHYDQVFERFISDPRFLTH